MRWLRALLDDRRRDAEMDEEMRDHVRRLTEENLAAGMGRDEARRAALVRFGSPEAHKESARAHRRLTWLADVARDLAYGARTLRKSPGFTAVVVLTLGLGIGANTAIFSLINGVLLRPLPARDPDGLVLLSEATISGGRSRGEPANNGGRITVYTQPLFERLRAHHDVFEGLAAEEGLGDGGVLRWTSPAGEELEYPYYGRSVSANYFDVLGVPAFRGRVFREDDARPGANPVIVLSHNYWQRRFGGDPRIVGAGVWVYGEPCTVAGVAPPAFAGTMAGNETDLWVALSKPSDAPEVRNHWWLRVFGRLRPGASFAAAEARANVTLQQYLAEDATSAATPPAPGGLSRADRLRAMRIGIEPGSRGFTLMRDGFRRPLLVLMAAVSLLLLIVCLNVSHLLLARSISRSRELSIRAALGATRARLLRQLLTETLLLAAMGAAAAAVVRRWITEGLLVMAAHESQARSLDVSGDGRVVAFTALVTLAAAALMGGIPAWQLSSRGKDLHGVLRATSQAAGADPSRRSIRGLLLTSQVALSLVLLVGAGLLYATLDKLRASGSDFDEAHLLFASVRTKTNVVREQSVALYDELARRLSALPGVRSAGASTVPPLSGSGTGASILLPGGRSERVEIDVVTPGYLETMRIALARGRSFHRDDRMGAPRVAVVNEAFARRFFTADDVASALGVRIHFDPNRPPRMQETEFEVVGVVKDAKTRTLKNDPGPLAYVSAFQSSRFNLGNVAVRVDLRTANAARMVEHIRGALEEDQRIARGGVKVATMTDQMDGALRHERLLSLLGGAFGLAAMVLMCIGLYGVISQWAAQQSAEIGVRVALGATSAGVCWMVMRQALAFVLAGLALGFPAALAASHLIRGVLFGVEPTDPRTFTLAAVVMFAVTLLAAYLPARRASRIDPMVTLRHE